MNDNDNSNTAIAAEVQALLLGGTPPELIAWILGAENNINKNDTAI
jgi:hypothetical protein